MRIPSWVAAAAWRWPSAGRLASWTPEAAAPLLQLQQEILGWRAHVAPSATLPSASQNNCSKHNGKKEKEIKLVSKSYLDLRIPTADTTPVHNEHLTQKKITVVSLFFFVVFFLMQKSDQTPEVFKKRLLARLACVRVRAWGGARGCVQGRAGKEMWPWTLCMTGPFSKTKKSDIPFH